LIANAQVPDAVAFMMTAGGLTALNKVPAAEQEALTREGKDPKLRPINCGATFAKTALRCAASTPSAMSAKAEIQDIQKGLGSAAGPESVVHLARQKLREGWGAGTDDVVNAFNAMKRNEMLKRTAKRWPESTSLYHKMYGFDAPIFYIFEAPDGSKTLRIMRSSEGSRMGDVLGSISFDFGIHDNYVTVAKEYVDFIFRALTDDLLTLFPPQASDDDWHILYERLAACLLRQRELNEPCGLMAHPDKGFVFLPAGAPDPKPDSILLTLTTITRTGFKVAGAFIGTHEGIISAATSKVADLQPRIDATVELAAVNKHAAFMLLGSSVNLAMDYYLRTTPPEAIAEAISNFDVAIDTAALRILTCSDRTTPVASAARLSRAHHIRALPCAFGGAGHTAASIKSPCAYLAAVIATAHAERLLGDCIDRVATSAATSYNLLSLLTGLTNLHDDPGIASAIPPSAIALGLSPSFAHRPATTPLARTKIQGILTRACGRSSRSQLRSGDPLVDGFPVHDMNHVHLLTSRSQLSRIYCASLEHPENRLDSSDFVSFARYHLGLPPLILPGSTRAGDLDDSSPATKDLAACPIDHGTIQLLDATGNHACSCKSAAKARYGLHGRLCRTIGHFAKLAGAEVRFEPPTSDLLLSALSPAQCRTLFPKRPGGVNSERAVTLNRMLEKLVNIPPGHAKEALAREAQQFALDSPDGVKGLRVDIQVSFDDSELWIDAGGVHPTAPSILSAVSSFVKKLHDTECRLGPALAKEAHMREPSPAVKRAASTKTKRYDPILRLAGAQYQVGNRKILPKFYPCIVSHLGEMSPHLIQIVEHITRKFTASVSGMSFEDGIKKQRRTGLFRRRFKDGLMAANAAGFGRTINAAGRPWTARSGDLDGLWEYV